MTKKVLIATNIYYNSVIQVGSQHYARAFNKLGYEVAYISFPISPLHRFLANKTDLINREKIYNNGGVQENNIWFYVPKSLFVPAKKPFYSSNFILNNWHKFSYPNINILLNKQGFNNVDFLWIENPSFEFLLDTVSYKHSIMRVSDYFKGFSNTWDNYYNKEKRIIDKVDKIIVTAANLQEKCGLKDKNNVIYTPNGVDIEFFENADKSFPAEFSNIPEPRIIFVGYIHEWFDLKLMYKIAKSLPEYNFVLIGPPVIDISILRKLKNIHILGAKPHSRIPQFLSHSQASIIPFKANQLVESVNPVKVYEYMACGLPVVSIDWEELRDMNLPIHLVKDDNGFIEKIKIALKQNEKNKLINCAKKQSWDERLNKIMQYF